MNHRPYNPDLTPSDFHLFGPMKVQLGGQKFQTEDELNHGVLNWPLSHNETFYAACINNCPDNGKNVLL
jgi:hypothetical protein